MTVVEDTIVEFAPLEELHDKTEVGGGADNTEEFDNSSVVQVAKNSSLEKHEINMKFQWNGSGVGAPLRRFECAVSYTSHLQSS